MAEAASDATAPSAPQQASTERVATDTPASSSPAPEMAPTGFQAVNAPSAAKIETTSSAAATPQGETPPTAPAVAQDAPQQTAQAASDVSNSRDTPSQMDGADDLDPATYGTRSRNRTGNARPNYAEDQEMDFEYSSSAATTGKKKPGDATPSNGPTPADPKAASDLARFVAVNSSNGGTNTPGAKASTPGSVSVPTGPTSKKRKAAGASNQPTPPSSNTPAPTTAAARKTAGLSALSMTPGRQTNVMTFTKHKACLNKRGELVADDGTKIAVNDHIYLVCEPPGDPYYLCRVMEFLHTDSNNPNSPVDAIRANWYYRPRDVQRFNSDSRLVYGTMHSDICPITSLRGKCEIKHRSEIDDLDLYRKERDAFYFIQVFDRFIRRWYECIPVSQVINVPDNVKKALDERWKFVVVEVGRVKELTSAVKTCKRCVKYCASSDSVDCAICKNSYHMNCVQPPLPKKPSRGFAWACGPCSRIAEQEEETQQPTAEGEAEEEEAAVEEEIEEQTGTSNDNTRAPSPDDTEMVIDDHPATQAEIALAKMWPMRYLGIHCRVEDALQYDDRAIYPRASSRLGPRHQANVNVWHGRPVELVKSAEIKKRYNKAGGLKNAPKLTKEQLAAAEADREEKAKRPKWVQDEPAGYVARGEDFDNDDPRCTAKVIYRAPEEPQEIKGLDTANPSWDPNDPLVINYVKQAKQLCKPIGVPPFGVNFLDKSLELLVANNYKAEVALKSLSKIDRRKDLREPVLNKNELIKFEEGVAKYGSEHRLVRLHMKTNLPNADIVRFYYLWKKTPKGREIWGNYGGRKGSKKKVENDSGARLHAEVAHEGDDSAFDNDKANKKGRQFQCKFCNTTHTRQWRRAPGVSAGQTITVTVTVDGKNGVKEKKDKRLLALCFRCAGLWRKYAIQWEEIDEVGKKVAQGGGKAWKKRIDEELLREIIAASDPANNVEDAAVVPSIESSEPPKKKSKTDAAGDAKKKEKVVPPPREPTPPIVPMEPSWRVLPCAVCRTGGDTVSCAHCKLTVHRRCFGLNDDNAASDDIKWICDQCQNDKNPEVSTEYACCLCLTEETFTDLIELPRTTHKKRTDRDRERERLEKIIGDEKLRAYQTKQLARNRPVMPREPLKRTTGNNWVHVHCATFTPEIRFSNSKALEVSEGFQNIPQAKYEAVCKLCKNKDHQNRVRHNAGACVECFQCQQNVHASCALEAGYIFGFDVTPVKGSRKDQVITAKIGAEQGLLTAGIWCKEHVLKSKPHELNEIADESGKTALQVYVENYKQADLTLTGTVRKANLAQLTRDRGHQAPQTAPGTVAINGSRRESSTNNIPSAGRRGARNSTAADMKMDGDGMTDISNLQDAPERRCVKCKIDATPRWHVLVKDPPVKKEPSPPKSPPLPTAPPPPKRYITLDNSQPERAPTEQPRQKANTNNIRFMAPGASGRAWEGMPDRFASRTSSHSVEPPQAAPAAASRDSEASKSKALVNGDGHHQNPTLAPSTPPVEPGSGPDEQQYLCHKCFLKKKLDPTPPPPERPEGVPPAVASPPRHPMYQMPHGWDRPPPQPGVGQRAPGQPFPMPWDPPPQQQQQQQMPPMAPSPSYGQPPAPQPYPPPPHYGQQPNGYHAPPPPGMHDRHTPNYPYPPPSNPAYPPQHAGAPRPSPYAPAPPGLANGIPSPGAANQPPYGGPPAPPSHYSPQQQRPHIDPRFAPPGPPGPPDNRYGPPPSHPAGPYGSAQPPPPQYASPHPPHAGAGPPPPGREQHPSPPGRAPASSVPPTVAAGQSGASASPSLRNLLD